MEEQEQLTRLLPGRSCAACKRRKIRCDREKPCSYCQKLGVDCVYPDGAEEARAPAKPRVNTPDDGLTLRLERIERLLLKFEERMSTWEGRREQEVDHDEIERPRKRYRSVPPLRHQRREQSTTIPILAQGLTVASSSESLHPKKPNMLALWQVYKECVDPLVKILHIPTVEVRMRTAIEDLGSTPAGTQALMFSIYYAAATSMRYTVSPTTMSFEERREKFRQYERGLQQSLLETDFLTNPTIETLQALTIYLTCAQYHGKMDYVWSVTGLLIRLAMKLELHQDSLDLPSLEAEARRRLWWAIVMLDFQIGEIKGTVSFISDKTYDTRLPRDINDDELDVVVESRREAMGPSSEMLFTVSRIQILQLARKMRAGRVQDRSHRSTNPVPRAESKALDSALTSIEKRCLLETQHVTSINTFTIIATRIMIAKLKFASGDPELMQTVRQNSKYNRWAWILDVEGIEEFKQNGSSSKENTMNNGDRR